MPTDPGPYDLDAARPVLCPGGTAVARPVTPDFYAGLDRAFDGFAGHVLVSQHRFAEAWPSWEMHPHGDEVVCLLSGSVDLVLWRDGREETVGLDTPGSYVIVPRATWHTARPRAVSTMLFITPGEGTRHAGAPGDADAA